MATDGELLKKMQQGQRAAMEQFYRRHAPYLFAVSRRYVANSEDAKDVLQESFVKIFSSISQVKLGPGDSLRPWATRIVVNSALNHLRSRRFETLLTEDQAEDIADDDVDADLLAPETVQRLIEELPTGYRTVFNLFAIEQLSHKEISSLLGISESTSASQFHRAKNLLKKKIKNFMAQENE